MSAALESSGTPLWYTDYNRISRDLLVDSFNCSCDKNVVFSAFSLYMLLAILVNATSGASQQEILDAVAGKCSADELTDDLKNLLSTFTKTSGRGVLKSSNGICVSKDYFDKLKPDFVSSMRQIFDADFFEGGEDIITKVNAWVRDKTDGMIDSIMDENSADGLKTVLMNAVAFDAQWLEPYEEYDVIPSDIFTNIDGSTSEVTMLASEEYEYIEDDYFTGFVKPYKAKHYAFMGLLPRRANSKILFGKSMQHIDFCKYFEQRIENNVDVMIPEFEITADTELSSYLESLGIQSVFGPQADFSNMMCENPQTSNSILQKAYLKFDRHGTKAAAVTEMAVYACCPDFERRKSVNLDRPFVYSVMNTDTGLPVFAGFVSRL